MPHVAHKAPAMLTNEETLSAGHVLLVHLERVGTDDARDQLAPGHLAAESLSILHRSMPPMRALTRTSFSKFRWRRAGNVLPLEHAELPQHARDALHGGLDRSLLLVMVEACSAQGAPRRQP
jgi:hypothetical protein